MGSKQTKYQLERVTDYLGFESFCNDLMSRQGYTDIDPLGGFKDKGRDAIHIGRRDAKTTIFSYTVRQDWEIKLFEDLDKIRKYRHRCDHVCFVSNQKLSANEIDKAQEKVKQKFGWTLEIFHLERIATLVDGSNAVLKTLHSNIFFLEKAEVGEIQDAAVHLDVSAYAQITLSRHKEWQQRYTPLLAQFREFKIFAVEVEVKTRRRVPVLSIPELAPLVILLGESGAGKTTALWRLATELSKVLVKKKSGYLPIIISLRNWTAHFRIRELVQNEFTGINASFNSIEDRLKVGDCLICFDGVNELPSRYPSLDQARRDLENFIKRYPQNRYIVTCRTADYDSLWTTLLKYHPSEIAPCFEIQRLDRRQIADYVKRHFKDEETVANQLLEQLELHEDKVWKERGSLLNLARIPLHLFMIILEFKKTRQLPSNKAGMLRTFVTHMVERDASKQSAQVPIVVKEMLLGELAYKSLQEGYYLSIPNNLAKTIIRVSFRLLRKDGEIEKDLTFAELWNEILSNNFLVRERENEHQASRDSPFLTVGWLHQMIFDYFLACEMIETLLMSKDSKKQGIMLDRMRVSYLKWTHPSQVSLGLIPYDQAARLLEILINRPGSCNDKLAEEAFKAQNQKDAFNISICIIERAMNNHDWDQEPLSKIALILPYQPFIEALIDTFKRNNESDREKMASIISEVVTERYDSEGAKRGEAIFQAWIVNKNEVVRFYAAQGSWERDKGQSAQTLKELYQKGSPEIKKKVIDLMDELGIT